MWRFGTEGDPKRGHGQGRATQRAATLNSETGLSPEAGITERSSENPWPPKCAFAQLTDFGAEACSDKTIEHPTLARAPRKYAGFTRRRDSSAVRCYTSGLPAGRQLAQIIPSPVHWPQSQRLVAAGAPVSTANLPSGRAPGPRRGSHREKRGKFWKINATSRCPGPPEPAVTSRGRRTPRPAPPSGSSLEDAPHERGCESIP